MQALIELLNERDWFESPELKFRFKQALEYRGFKFIGEGAFRFVLSHPEYRGWVIKVARHRKGVEANEQEIAIWDFLQDFPETAQYLARVEATLDSRIILQRRVNGKFPSGVNMYLNQLIETMEREDCPLATHDVHLKNVIIDKKGSPKFIDFGEWSVL